MKEKTSLLAVILICLSFLGSGTLAYYTSDHYVHNVITSGGVNIEIEEWQETDEGELEPYPEESVGVMPGSEVSKIVTVKNNDEEAFIRAKFEVTVLDENEEKMELDADDLNKIITIALNNEDWLQKEGDSEWWYYNASVAKGDSTEAFFTKVIFDGPNMTNEYSDCTFGLDVKAQAVQKANNGDSALTAAGWPKE